MILQLLLWLEIVRPPVFSPADLTRQVESFARERTRTRSEIAATVPALTPEEARERARALSAARIH